MTTLFFAATDCLEMWQDNKTTKGRAIIPGHLTFGLGKVVRAYMDWEIILDKLYVDIQISDLREYF